MRAATLRGPRELVIEEVPVPAPADGEVLIEVERVGVCGTDVELFTGEMAYLHTGHASYPLRPGHEWCGRVTVVGRGVDAAWVGRRVTGDTMLGDQTCVRCRRGRQHLCDEREEVGIRRRAGALAGYLTMPVWSLHRLSDNVDAAMGAMVEPGGNAYRAVRASGVRDGDRLLVLGPGTIGLLAALFGRAAGAEVHVLGLPGPHLDLATKLGFAGVWTEASLPDLVYDAVIEASTSSELPAVAAEIVEPGGRVVFVGLAGQPSLVDTRQLAMKDVTAVGVLSASPGLAATIKAYASGTVDPRPLVAGTVALDDVAGVLSGERPAGVDGAPKIQVDPAV